MSSMWNKLNQITTLHQSCARIQLQDQSSTGTCFTATDTEGKPSFWMFTTLQQPGPHTTCILETQLHLLSLTPSEEHREHTHSSQGWPLIFSQEGRQSVSTALWTALVSDVLRWTDAKMWPKKRRDICSSARSAALLPSDQGENPQIPHATWSVVTGVAASFSQSKVFSVWKMRNS